MELDAGVIDENNIVCFTIEILVGDLSPLSGKSSALL
jgi:hypothetical protein